MIVETLKYYQINKEIKIHAWCLMSSHLHLIISSRGMFSPSDFLRDFKKFTNREVIRIINTLYESRKEWLLDSFYIAGKGLKRIKNYKIWQDGNHPIELITNYFIDQKLSYIHDNPVKAEIVDEPHYYLYSSARDYAGIKGLLAVDLIE
jgi:putative transposase